MSSSADAENMGNARRFGTTFGVFNPKLNELPQRAFCYLAKNEAKNGRLEDIMTSITGFLLADYFPSLKHESIVNIMENPNSYCVK